MHGLAVYVKEGLSFAQDLPLENSLDSYLCFQLTLFHSVSYFFFLYQLLSLSLYMVFYYISSKTDEVLLINPSTNVFVFGDFNAHQKDWLTYSGETDRLGKLCYNFSISNDLTQMIKFPPQIPDCDSHSPALLDLFISSDISICPTMAYYVDVSVYIDFPSNSQRDALFHHIAYDYSRTDWDGLYDCLGDVPWAISLSLVLLLLLVNFVNWFR